MRAAIKLNGAMLKEIVDRLAYAPYMACDAAFCPTESGVQKHKRAADVREQTDQRTQKGCGMNDTDRGCACFVLVCYGPACHGDDSFHSLRVMSSATGARLSTQPREYAETTLQANMSTVTVLDRIQRSGVTCQARDFQQIELSEEYDKQYVWSVGDGMRCAARRPCMVAFGCFGRRCRSTRRRGSSSG